MLGDLRWRFGRNVRGGERWPCVLPVSLSFCSYLLYCCSQLSEFPYSSGSKGTAAKIKLASDPFLVSFFSHVSSGSSGFFAYFFMPSQIFCAFLQVCALFFLAIKSDFLWSRERHNTLSSFRTHTTSPRLWHNFQRRNGENYSWSSRLSLGLWRQTCTYASSCCRFP